MPDRMPTGLELEAAFAGLGVSGQTQTVHQALREEERRARLMRDAQPQDFCGFYWSQDAVFDEKAEGGQLLTDWIDFGTLRFVGKPVFTTGSEWLPQEGDPSVNGERSDLSPSTHLIVPGGAEVVGWKTDETGYYQAAKLVLFAYGSVPSGYRIRINGLWAGLAIRKG